MFSKKEYKDSRLKCNDLGFLEVAFPPSPDELKAYYAELYYQTEQGGYQKSYSDQELAYINLKIAQRADIVDQLRKEKTSNTFLDVGCGEGFALSWFNSKGWSVKGLDYSSAGLEGANPDLLSYVEIGDLFEILDNHIHANNQYDLVWLNNVLEHVLNPVELLTSLQGLVAADGLLVVTVPNDGSSYQNFLLSNGYVNNPFWVALPDHLSYFKYESLIQIAESTDWRCHDVIADFPIDFFLLHPQSNYVKDRSNGHLAHQARINMDLMLAEKNSFDKINDFYRSLARIGLGRNLTAFLSHSSK